MNREQLKTILWLRWRLTRNQWQRSGGFGAVLAIVIAGGAVLLGGVSFVGAMAGAALGLGDAAPHVVMGLWFGITVGFLLFWLIGLMAELQRSETIDLQRLMHLPVGLGQMFAINYVASHFALSIILVLPAMTGLALGLAWSRGPAMVLLLPLGWSMVFMVTAWTYCLRGWLASMMSNPRRRRAIIMGISLAFILLAQGPNLYFNVFGRHNRSEQRSGTTPEERQAARTARQAGEKERFDNLVEMQRFVPPLWVPYGALALAEHRIVPALLGVLGSAGLGVLGLRRAYRSTLRFYHGQSGAQAGAAGAQPEPAKVTAPVKARKNWLEMRLPTVPDEAAAVALGSMRSMLRAPEVKMAWGTVFLVTLIIGASVLSRGVSTMPEMVKPFVLLLAMGVSLFMLVQFLGNQFGYDRQGFRAFVLSPIDRRWILLGKNIATWPVGGTFQLLLLGLMTYWLRLPILLIASALLQLGTLLLLSSVAGNLLSILAPFRIEPGSMKPTKMPALALVTLMFCQLFFPLILLPVGLPPLAEFLWRIGGGAASIPVNLLLSLLLAVLVAFLYVWSLAPLGRLLQSREIKILDTVTAGQE